MVFVHPQIARYRTGSEYVVRKVTKQNVEFRDEVDVEKMISVYEVYENAINRLLEDNVIPILTGDIHNVEKRFQEQLPDFSKKIEELNKMTFEEIEEPEKIVAFIFKSYDLLEQVIKTQIIGAEFKHSLLATLEVLKDFDSVFLGILEDRPEQLSAVLDEIRKDEDFQDFETSRNGLLLAFFCMLIYVSQELKDKQKLMKIILEISEKYSYSLQGWTDTIDIMSNPEEIKHVKEAEEFYKLR